MKIENKIPEFTMPEEITEGDQIELLELRIRELERDLIKARKASDLYWNDNGRSMCESIGLTVDDEKELSKILLHWCRKFSYKEKDIFKAIITCPLSFRDKILMLTIYCSSKPNQPDKQPPVSPEDFLKMLLGGKR